MAPKGKKDDKSKGKDSKDAGGDKGGKQKGAQSINVRHILSEKHAKSQEAIAKLNGGAKFDEVAREFSEDKARQGKGFLVLRRHRHFIFALELTNRAGGSLGWKGKGALMPEFEKVAFELEPSTTGNPKWAECKTSEGYHLVMVEGRK